MEKETELMVVKFGDSDFENHLCSSDSETFFPLCKKQMIMQAMMFQVQEQLFFFPCFLMWKSLFILSCCVMIMHSAADKNFPLFPIVSCCIPGTKLPQTG